MSSLQGTLELVASSGGAGKQSLGLLFALIHLTFVGLGIMGAAMAKNLLGAGHELVVHNRTRAKAEGLADHGAGVADSPEEVAERSDVVVTMLPGPLEVKEVIAGQGGLLEGAREGSLIVIEP